MAARFLTSALDGSEWSATSLVCFTPGEMVHGTHWIRGYVAPEPEEKNLMPLTGIEPRSSSP
jgi:hypothetical protein